MPGSKRVVIRPKQAPIVGRYVSVRKDVDTQPQEFPLPSQELNAAHLGLIRRLAAGEERVRWEAVQTHRSLILAYRNRYGNTDECNFMREVDNPAPDEKLKEHYRKRIQGDIKS